jgi:hypothetical protein
MLPEIDDQAAGKQKKPPLEGGFFYKIRKLD